MATAKLYLDARALKQDGTAPIKVAINHKSQTAYILTGINIYPEQWDKITCKVIGTPQKNMLNTVLNSKKAEIDMVLMQVPNKMSMNARQIKDAVMAVICPDEVVDKRPTFISYFVSCAEKKPTKRTREIYMATYNKLHVYDRRIDKLYFEDIDKKWLRDFELWLSETLSVNAMSIHLRNIRSVFNEAIDDEITSNYPFRKFKIKNERTRKRNLSVEDLRKIIFADNLPDWTVKYRDFFVLTFLLIGINTVDLCNLTKVVKGRIEYKRAKTHKPYSIKVEPEAMEIIERYSGGAHLINILDSYHDYRSFYMNMCRGLREIRDVLGLEELTTYWARHSWATIAASLDIPKDTIAAALGHGGNTVTDIYIDFDQRKVDEANRKVIDYVFAEQEKLY